MRRTFSASRLGVWQQCRRKYRFQYVDKAERGEAGPALQLGIALHGAIESGLNHMRQGYIGDHAQVCQWLEAPFKAYWVANAGQPPDTTDYLDGLTMLRTWARKAVDFVGPGECEQAFELQLAGSDVVVNGRMDLVLRDGEGGLTSARLSREPRGTVMVIDWKSNRMLPSRTDVEEDVQFDMYALAARKLYPEAKRVVVMPYYLRYGVGIPVEPSVERLADLSEYLVMAAGQLDRLEGAVDQEAAWPARLNTYCNWCDWRSKCEAFRESTVDVTATEIDFTDPHAIALEREAIGVRKKVLEARYEKLTGALKQHLDVVPEVRAGGKVYSIGQSTTTIYQPRDLVRELPMVLGCTAADVLDCMTVGKGKLDALIDSAGDEEVSAQALAVLERVGVQVPETRLSTKKVSTK